MTPLITRLVVGVCAWIVPAPMRARWREEWLGELAANADRESRRASTRLWGVPVDAMQSRADACTQTLREILTTMPTSLDLRMAFRITKRSPLLSLTSVVAMAVGIALTTIAFTIVRDAFFGTLPVPSGHEVVSLTDFNRMGRHTLGLSLDEFQRRRPAMTTVQGAGAYSDQLADVSSADSPVGIVKVTRITTDAFDVLRVRPLLGRTFALTDGDLASPLVSIVSHAFATRVFGIADAAIGQTIQVAGAPVTIVGVHATGFKFPLTTDIWLPLRVAATGRDSAPEMNVRVFARLRSDVTYAQAETELSGLAAQVPAEADIERVVQVMPFARARADAGQEWVGIGVVAAVGLILLVSIANVANLMLVRSAARQHELAIRTAIGATRLRLMVSLGMEAALLAVMAAGAGLVLARLGLNWFRTLAVDLPFWATLSLDSRVLLFAGTLTLIAAVGSSIGPALRVTSGAGTIRFGRVSASLVILETAVAVALLGTAGILGRGLIGFGYHGMPFDAEHILLAQLDFRQTAPTGTDAAAKEAYTQQVDAAVQRASQQLRGMDHVRMTATGIDFPGEDGPRIADIHMEGDEVRRAVRVPEISEDFLPLMQATPTLGRNFTAAEVTSRAAVAIVNEPFVRKHLKGRRALGLRIRVGESGPWREIVGVVPDLGLSPGDPNLADGVYVPRRPQQLVALALLTDGPPQRLAPALHTVARGLSPAPTIRWSRSLAEQLNEPVSILRLMGVGLFVMGGVALLLACTGIYAIIAFTVEQRRREIAIRRAIGAGSLAITRTLLARSSWQLIAGGVLGGVLGLGLEQLFAALPFAIQHGGPWFLAAVGGAVIGSGVVACLVPLRRALAVNPLRDLRG
jgi:predicted permease